jgi:hypothetical protein
VISLDAEMRVRLMNSSAQKLLLAAPAKCRWGRIWPPSPHRRAGGRGRDSGVVQHGVVSERAAIC